MSYTACVITVSDKGYARQRTDTSGPKLVSMLEAAGYDVVRTALVPDDRDMIQTELLYCADEAHIHLVLTTGGTGFSPRDITPEATRAVLERETPGIPEYMRYVSMQITPRGMLSRSAAGLRGQTLIINLPGSEKAAAENLTAVLPSLSHGLAILTGAESNCGGDSSREAHHHG
ncbi:MAG: MogA/MoaB family molybdenum cofactor biosynthesis protein [Clostridiales bacterium]|nr:MogA/MoaB family molybdenum cofactor biosynthesis protein [Clostridiales bacterium]